jgi:hypothetical protein
VSAGAGEGLDALLGEWGKRSRLTAGEAEAVRLAIVGAQPAALDAAWWRDLVGQVSGQVIKASTFPAASRTALRAGLGFA